SSISASTRPSLGSSSTIRIRTMGPRDGDRAPNRRRSAYRTVQAVATKARMLLQSVPAVAGTCVAPRCGHCQGGSYVHEVDTDELVDRDGGRRVGRMGRQR